MASNGTNHEVNGATDLYQLMLEVKNGMPNGAKRGCAHFTKTQAKALKIEWSFVENSVQVLGLKIKQHGKYGYLITA